MLLAALALCAGCASSNTSEWVKAGVTDEQREKDKNDCLFDSTETAPGAGGAQRRLNQDRYRRCLEGKGYTLKVGSGSQ